MHNPALHKISRHKKQTYRSDIEDQAVTIDTTASYNQKSRTVSELNILTALMLLPK